MTMLTLSKWGNAQAVRLPKAMREQVGMPVENGAIVLKPARSAKRAIRVANLASVFKDRKEPYRACEDDFGAPAGNEGL